MPDPSTPSGERQELLERLSAWLDAPLTALSFTMLGLLVVELAADLDPHWTRRVEQAQTAIWAIFAAAFALELTLAPAKGTYLRKHWLTAVSVLLPALRVVRIFRVARVLRGLRLVRLVTAVNRGSRALGEVAERGHVGYVALLTGLVVVAGAAGGYYFERGEPGASIVAPGDALWWAATTVSTINSPLEAVTFEGRVIGLLLRLFALAVSGYLTAIIAAYLLGRRPEQDTARATDERLAALERQVARLAALLERERAGRGQ